MKLRFLMSPHRQNSVRDKVIGKKWIYLERNTVHRQSMSHVRRRKIWCGVFLWACWFHRLINGWLCPLPPFLGDFQELTRPLPTCWSLMVDSRTVMVLVGVSLSLLIQSQRVHTEDQGQVQVDASATLDLFGSNKLMLCPPAMSGLCYFFFF